MITFKLKEILKEKNMTIKELHEKTGISQNNLSLIANGKSKGIQLETLEKILEATEARLEDMLDRTSDLYELSIEGVNNDYTRLDEKKTKEFTYKLIHTTSEGERQSAFQFSFSVFYYQINRQQDFRSRQALHISFINMTFTKDSEDYNKELANQLTRNNNPSVLSAIAYLVTTDLLWNLRIMDFDLFSLVVFSWSEFARDSIPTSDYIVPVSTFNLHLKFKEKNPYPLIADLSYLKESFSNIQKVTHNTESGDTSVSIYFK